VLDLTHDLFAQEQAECFGRDGTYTAAWITEAAHKAAAKRVRPGAVWNYMRPCLEQLRAEADQPPTVALPIRAGTARFPSRQDERDARRKAVLDSFREPGGTPCNDQLG